MMQDYLHALEKELNGFPPDERSALMDEIRSHMESGQADEGMGKDPGQRESRLMNELGSPEDMGRGLKALYRPNRFLDYLLIAIPYTLSLYFTEAYLRLQPQYPWMDIRLNVLIDLILIAIGLWKRSASVTLFWINIAVMQLSWIVLQGFWQPYWYFGIQTIAWAALLMGLLTLFGRIVWKHRHDALIAIYALLPFSMDLLGNALWGIRPVSYISNPLDRSLLVIFLRMQDGSIQFYGTLATMALFFLPLNRNMRWTALVLSALMIGFSREYLVDYQTGNVAFVAQWVYYLYVLVPVTMVVAGWLLERNKTQRMRLAA
jgi:HAAS domain-containing protein